MLTKTALEDLQAKRGELAREAKEFMDSIEGQPSKEQREKLREYDTGLGDLDGEIKVVTEDAATEARINGAADADADAARSAAPGMYPTTAVKVTSEPGDVIARQMQADALSTPGDVFIRSEQYQEWMKKFPDGGPQTGNQYQGDPVVIPGIRELLGLRTATEKLTGLPDRMRALITSADPSAGTLVRPDFRGLLEPGLVRPLSVRQLVTVIPTSTDAIEYVREASRTRAAAVVAEATAVTGTSGTKPEGGLTFAVVQDVVRTIAEWVPATKRILADAPALRAYVDQFLADDLATALEDEMITGSGSGEHFAGILNAGIQTLAAPTGTNTDLDSFRIAKRMIRVTARTDATALLLNPADAEAIELVKDSQGRYLGAGPWLSTGYDRVWGIPIVETESLTAGTGLMGDFRRAVLFDREQTTISVGTAGDDFIRNIVRVLGELRAAFGVLRPSAFVKITL